jgi:type I restriction enzyme R subunit
LVDLKDEIPVLKNAHTRVLKHFHGLDLDDFDLCILSLKEDINRQTFQTDFRIFAKQMDIILPDPAATPFLRDLKRLGKIAVGARNLYRDEQLDIAGVGAKVRELIEEHVFSTGINPKIAPVDLLAADYKEQLNEHKSSRAQASEIENAIKHHIKINLEGDPEYYKKLSERLEDIIRQYGEKWDELVQLLLVLRDNIDSDHKKEADDLGLSINELAFYNIMMAELANVGGDTVEESSVARVKWVVEMLAAKLEEESKIVDFFDKWDEEKRIKREIKRTIIEHFDESLVKPVTERFMELAKAKFK